MKPGATAGWTAELRRAFEDLAAGNRPRVGFAAPEGLAGEVGREFNALAEELEELGKEAAGRELRHRLRNRLAGILAALHVLRESGELTPAEEKEVEEAVRQARQVDAHLRGE